jgi:hypothetical protein
VLRVTARIREMFGVVVTARDIFATRDVASLAELVRGLVLADVRRMSAAETTRGE